tara:strand:+ start:11 stop:307 length:297 start_codon:yes stop_codon:yes gene_type:complete
MMLLTSLHSGFGTRDLSSILFRTGLVVKVKNYWGAINVLGELVVPAKYKKLTDFNNGYALATDKNESYVVDKKGVEKEIISTHKIEGTNHFTEGLAQY